MKDGVSKDEVKKLKAKFENGAANNAQGTTISQDTSSDFGLSTNNLRRREFQFTNFRSTVENAAAAKREQEQKDAQIAKQLQIEADEIFAKTLANQFG